MDPRWRHDGRAAACCSYYAMRVDNTFNSKILQGICVILLLSLEEDRRVGLQRLMERTDSLVINHDHLTAVKIP